jgi:hypothetical protein
MVKTTEIKDIPRATIKSNLQTSAICYPQKKGEKKPHHNRKNKEEVELYKVSTSLSSEYGASAGAVYIA